MGGGKACCYGVCAFIHLPLVFFCIPVGQARQGVDVFDAYILANTTCYSYFNASTGRLRTMNKACNRTVTKAMSSTSIMPTRK